MATREIITADQIKARGLPFYGVFVDKDGVEHELLELGGGGGGDGSGVTTYSALAGKPQINGITLAGGNNSLAALGIMSSNEMVVATDDEIQNIINNL
jgi:hypothetical protein